MEKDFADHIFSNFSPPNWRKKVQKWNEAYGYMDVDAINLKNIFQDRFSEENFHLEYTHDRPFKDFMSDCIQVMNSDKKNLYDCFFFAFLTFSDTGDERLHFSNSESENLVPLELVLEEVKKQEVTWGKPKIFLLQADDMSLIPKGDEKEKEKKVKIPQDADRLIITSYIPQKVANNDSQEKNPSFLIQAFKDALLDEESNDLLSLTAIINGRMADMIEKSKKKSENQNMPVSLVTSTLTKLFYLRK